MKKFKITALLLAGILTAASVSACGSKKKSNSGSDEFNDNNSSDYSYSVTTPAEDIGKNEIKVAMSEEADENDTVFKLNSVYDAGKQYGIYRYIYCDVTIRNSTDQSYTLSTLNNFYIELPDGEKIYSDIRTQMYALNNFADGIYSSDPFEIPANGEFSGVIGGFLVEDGKNDFTVGFFPTKASPNDKESVITIEVKPDDIKAVSSDMLK